MAGDTSNIVGPASNMPGLKSTIPDLRSNQPAISQKTVASSAANAQRQQQQAKAVNQKKIDQGWVNFGSNKLNINTTTAKGLEKALGVIGSFIIKVQAKINEILYGKLGQAEDANLIKRLLNKGVVNLLADIAAVDFCNILNYALNSIPGAQQFDPTKPPDSNDVLSRKKWQLQKTAYDTQQYIDQYYRDYLDKNNPESRVGLFLLIQQINSSLNNTVLSQTDGINDSQLKSTFPQLGPANNFLQNVLGIFNRYTDVRQIPSEDVQNLIETVDKVRYYCILIQGLSTPANAVALIDTSLNGAIQKELADVSKVIVNPAVATRVLRSIINTVNNINSIGQKILGFINTAQVIIKICILLIRIFNIVKAFFLAIPAPNIATTVGITTKFSDIYQEKLKEQGEKKLIKRLGQISAILNLMAIVVTSLVAAMSNIILKLEVIYLNLQSCQNVDPGLVEELKNTINNLTNTGNKLQDFLDKYNDQQQKSESQFGKYVIQIVTEQVVDEGINLRRRYGIARDTNGYIVVQSTPTFASLDLIIINEVKALLVSKGLVSSNINSLSSEDQVTVIEAARFLGEDELDLSNLQLSLSDIQTIEEQDDELGISTFVDNLPGGKKLRRRIRQKMLENARKLGSDLKSTDPQGKYSSNIVSQQKSQENRLQIQDLNDQIDQWKKELAIAATQGPIGLVIVRDRIKKIKEAEKKIKQLGG